MKSLITMLKTGDNSAKEDVFWLDVLYLKIWLNFMDIFRLFLRIQRCFSAGILALLLFILCYGSGSAQSIKWTHTLPFLVRATEFNPLSHGNVLYAGAKDSEGIYKSYDGGYTWDHLLRGPNPLEEYSSADLGQIYIMPTDTSILIAGSTNTRVGIYRSTDGGYNWTQVLTGLSTEGQTIFELPDFQDASLDTLVLGESVTGHMWRSVNKGATWDSVPNPSAAPNMCTLALQPYSDRLLLSGTGNGIISRTTNAGATWEVTHDSSNSENADIPRIVFDPNDPWTVWATVFAYPKESFIVSHDAGLTWQVLPSPPNEWAYELDPASKSGTSGSMRMWIGRFSGLDTTHKDHFDQSTDGGNTWIPEHTFDSVVDIWMIKYDTASGRLAVATSSGMFIGETRTNAVSQVAKLSGGVYPNPVSETLHLTSEFKNSELEIIDVTGRTVWSADRNLEHKFDIDVCQWPDGVYTVVDQNSARTSRVVVMHEVR